MLHTIEFKNDFKVELFRKNKLIQTLRGHNGVTVEGKNHLLDVCFGAAVPLTQVDPWYIGLINNSPTPTLSENDTLASHAGWTEFTGYTGNRLAWTDADAAAKVKAASAVTTFPITATATVYGIFVCSVATTTTGTLWATGAFSAPLSVVNTDQIKVTYNIRT